MRDTAEKDYSSLSGSGTVWLSLLENSMYGSQPRSSLPQAARWCFFLLSFLCGLCPFLSPPCAHAALVRTMGSPLSHQRVMRTTDEEALTAHEINWHLAEQENVLILGTVESENVGETTGGKESDDEGDDDGDDDDDDDDDDGADDLPVTRLVSENFSGGVLGVSTATGSELGIASGWTWATTPGYCQVRR